jgi:hypothetical protein
MGAQYYSGAAGVVDVAQHPACYADKLLQMIK